MKNDSTDKRKTRTSQGREGEGEGEEKGKEKGRAKRKSCTNNDNDHHHFCVYRLFSFSKSSSSSSLSRNLSDCCLMLCLFSLAHVSTLFSFHLQFFARNHQIHFPYDSHNIFFWKTIIVFYEREREKSKDSDKESSDLSLHEWSL